MKLENVKPGDRLIIERSRGLAAGLRTTKVVKTYKNYFTTLGPRDTVLKWGYDGNTRPRDDYPSVRIVVPTPELEEQLRRQRLLFKVQSFKPDELSTEKLEAIVAILESV